MRAPIAFRSWTYKHEYILWLPKHIAVSSMMSCGSIVYVPQSLIFCCDEHQAVASPSPISSSRSSWYGPYYSSQAPPTGQLPSLINNQDHAASRPLALRGTRSLIRFPSTSSVVGDEVPADAIRRTPRKSVSSRAVLIQGTGDVPSDTLREALDIGHFSIGGSIDGVRNDIYETAAQSMNVGSHKSLSPAKYSQNDNASLTVRSNGNLSGHDPRQVYSN